eukprot:SAG31_NODE_3443_length_4260_cov_39.705600_2_plen_156_part_00
MAQLIAHWQTKPMKISPQNPTRQSAYTKPVHTTNTVTKNFGSLTKTMWWECQAAATALKASWHFQFIVRELLLHRAGRRATGAIQISQRTATQPSRSRTHHIKEGMVGKNSTEITRCTLVEVSKSRLCSVQFSMETQIMKINFHRKCINGRQNIL